ncbi:hypothetical protein [Emticicia soli]|uniref:DUF6089 domain-containing protein n=1 Tax=Emticicia soli TaxID=2027878 RepID=A0ABW5JDL8_9BACT
MRFLNIQKALLKGLLCFSFVLLITEENFAQGGVFSKKNKLNQYSYISIGGGTSHYFGDLSPYKTFYYALYTNVQWNGTINYTRQFSPQFAARASFTWARIVGDDFTYAKRNLDKYHGNFLRNLHFRNDIKEFALSGIFNLLPQTGKGQQGRRKVMPFATLGIGFYGHQPQARDSIGVGDAVTKYVPLKELQTSGQTIDAAAPKPYSLLQVVFPISLGLKVKLTEKLDLNIEGGLRITPFDYLDDVGRANYPSPVAMRTSNPDGLRFSNRADEDIAARTGQSRVQIFQDIIARYGYAGASTTPSPSLDGEKYVGFGAGKPRGGATWDSYIVTQFTLSYNIGGSGIKCPPIK